MERGDCDDADPAINPGVPEVCYDGVDNDCRSGSADCDCDGDGVDGLACTDGADCDDADPSVYPGAPDLIDGLDNNCDGAPDEGGYCNAYFPLENGPGNSRSYTMTSQSGAEFTELAVLEAWDPASGAADLRRTLTDTSGTTYEVLEDRSCEGGLVSLRGWDGSAFGFAIGTVAYSGPRVELLAPAGLTVGATWENHYDAADSAGLGDWTIDASSEVTGIADISVVAGTFMALEVRTAYTITDNSGGDLAREGNQVSYFVEGLGLVYTEDFTTAGELMELRELSSYVGFFP